MTQVSRFIGESFTVDDCEMLSLAKIPHSLSAREAELFQKKWFPYRRLHPVKLTYFYASCYDKAFRDCVAATRDVDQAKEVTPFSPADIFESRELTAMWSARQAADSVGARYEWALRWLMKRFADRGWRHLPRPHHLYAEELVLDMGDAWKEECAVRLQLVEDEFFLAKSFVGHPDQIAYRDWLVEQLKARGNVAMGLTTVVFRRGLMSEEFALEKFGPGALKHARQIFSAAA